jgi:hypothetical protein
VELMRTILFENPDAFASLGLQDVSQQREELIDEICALLASANKPNDRGAVSGGKYSPADIKTLRANVLQWKSKSELIEYSDDILLKQRMAKQSVGELQQIVKNAQPPRRADGMPQLPEHMVLPGEIKARKVDREFLETLMKQDYEFFRNRIVKIYGSNQVDERRGLR